MELQQLRCFVALAETLNFSKAAAKTFVSQPSLSRYISRLESEFDVKLFERGKNFTAVRLTRTGSFLLPKARAILNEADDIAHLLRQYRDDTESENTIIVGIDYRICVGELPRHIYTFAKQSDKNILTKNLSGSEIPDMLRSGRIDLGFTMHLKTQDMAGLTYTKLMDLPLFLVLHEDLVRQYGTEDPAELLQHIKVYNMETDADIISHSSAVVRAMGVVPSIVMCENARAMEFHIQMGHGCAILTPGTHLPDPSERSILIPPQFGTVPVYGLMLVQNEDIQSLLDYIQVSMQDN